MRNYLNPNIRITEDAEGIPLDVNLEDEKHQLSVEVDKENGDVYLNFSSRVALYDFARNLLHESIYGDNDSVELYPLATEDKLCIVEGVRLSLGSSRVFINCSPD